jgi:hypothetical protein
MKNIKPIILSPTADILEPKLTKKFTSSVNLIFAAGKHSLPDVMVHHINSEIDAIGKFPGTTDETAKKLTAFQKDLLQKLKKEQKLVPKNHYRNIWLTLGMVVFGLPIGTILGFLFKNLSLLAVGMPIGLGIGIAFGSFRDQKVKNEGRQLDFEVT